MLLDLMEYLAM